MVITVLHGIIWSWYTCRWWVGGIFGTAKRGLGLATALPGHPRCTKCNSSTIKGQYQSPYLCIVVRCSVV